MFESIRGTPAPEGAPDGVTLRRLDVPFLHLTWFLVKLSFASALAFLVTGVLWLALFVAVGSLARPLLPFGSEREPAAEVTPSLQPPAAPRVAAEVPPAPAEAPASAATPRRGRPSEASALEPTSRRPGLPMAPFEEGAPE